MTEIFHLPAEIHQEFSIDESGLTYASQSALARLCGVTRQSINELLAKILSGKGLSEPLKPFAGIDYRESGKIQDKFLSPESNARLAKRSTIIIKRPRKVNPILPCYCPCMLMAKAKPPKRS